MKNILDYWPITSPPRPNQIVALEWMQTQSAKYIILEAPVGFGKSLVALTYSRYLANEGNSFILTPQIILQRQYEGTLTDGSLMSLYGKSNYKCKAKNTSCDIGGILKPRCDNCPHQHAIAAAKSAKDVVLNYRLGLLLFNHTELFKRRSLITCDECHTLEDHLTEFGSVAIYKNQAEKFGIKWKRQTQLDKAYTWMKEVYRPAVDAELSKQYKIASPLMEQAGDKLTKKQEKILKDYDKLEHHSDEILMFLLMDVDQVEEEFVLVHDADTFKFRYLTGEKNFKKILDPYAKRILFMSATVLDHKGFCRDLGIDISDVAFLSLDSDFPIENRMVAYLPQMKMNAKWHQPENNANRKKMIAMLIKILEMHEDESGILHTGNFQVAKWLVDQLEFAVPQQVIHHNPDSGDNRNSIIDQFTGSVKPTILISPSITEGLDLYDDIARFAIFIKIGFPFLGDQWIKRRLEMSQEWYQRKTMIDVIQGCGRIVRSKDDWGQVYILDQSFAYLKQQTNSYIPQWWKDGYQRL